MKIALYMGSWPQNIGNAFFDLGAFTSLKAAFPDAEIYRTGGAVHWMFNASQRIREGRVLSALRSKLGAPYQSKNSLEISELVDVDLLVFAGMSLCEEFVQNNGKSLLAASRRGVKILGLGAGGAEYSRREREVFNQYIRTLEGGFALISRDQLSFDMFSDASGWAFSGIDSAFFLPEYYEPPRLISEPFDVVTFDSNPKFEDQIEVSRAVIRTHHDMWGPLSKTYTSRPRTLISDVPEDYLTLYANAVMTWSDRVHACVAAMAYGNSAQLFSDTPRRLLFDQVGAESVTSSPTKIDISLLNSLRETQIVKIREAVAAV